jgi:hypothetical protein
MSKEKIEKVQSVKNKIVNNSHKIDLIIGISLIIYSIYAYMNSHQYFFVAGIAGIISIVMYIIKPAKLMDNYFQKKIIKKD